MTTDEVSTRNVYSAFQNLSTIHFDDKLTKKGNCKVKLYWEFLRNNGQLPKVRHALSSGALANQSRATDQLG